MAFLATDRDWSDYHQGLSPERKKRYEKLLEEMLDALIPILKRHAGKKRAINAMIPHGIFAVGVTGDQRIYAPVVALTFDRFPGYGRLQKISTEITNSLPVSRVIYNMTMKVVCTPTTQFLVPRQRKQA